MEVGPSKPDAPASTAGIPAIGEIFAQKYRLERSLGRGAMGAIFAAEHISLRQRVAVKFLLPRTMTLPGASARFLREARAAAAIRSEHVARVIDVGTAELGIPYLVMEYLRGRDLQQELDSRGPLPVSEAVDYVIQGCEAVAEAHARDIIHRDLKPGNLFLTTGATGAPIVKVLDFGLSKSAAPEDDGKLTASEMMLGSPCYMSPEQVRCSKHVDARTDLWSLGIILYQLLTARFPFDASKLSALFVAIVTQAPTPPRVHRMDLPAQLEDIILRCLEKEPELRVQTVAELSRELAPFGTEHSARALAQIEAIARGRAFPSSRPLGPPGDGVASTLPAATNDHQRTSSTLPQPDADPGACAGRGACSTVVAPGAGDHLTTLPSEGTLVVARSSSDAASGASCSLPIVTVDDGTTLKMARNSGPTLPAEQDSRPTLKMARDDRPSPGMAPEEGPTLTMARASEDGPTLAMARASEDGPTLAMAREDARTPAMAQEDGPTLAMAREDARTPAMAQEDGPTLAMAREDARTPAMAQEDGPTLAMAREDARTPAMAQEDGPTLAMAREDGPTLTMARDDGPTLPWRYRLLASRAPSDVDESAGSMPVVTERRSGQQSSLMLRNRTRAGARIVAAAALTAAAAFGATLWSRSAQNVVPSSSQGSPAPALAPALNVASEPEPPPSATASAPAEPDGPAGAAQPPPGPDAAAPSPPAAPSAAPSAPRAPDPPSRTAWRPPVRPAQSAANPPKGSAPSEIKIDR